MKKKIAIIINSLGTGGSERTVSIMANEWNEKYDLHIILMSNAVIYEIPKNSKIHFLRNKAIQTNPIINILQLPFLTIKLMSYLAKYNIQNIVAFNARPIYISALSKMFRPKLNCIVMEGIDPSKELNSSGILKKLIGTFLLKFLYPKADLIIPNSKGIKVELKKHYELKNKIEVIYNAIDLNSINEKKNIKQTFKFDKDQFYFINIGSFFYQKNHRYLIDAFHKANLPQTKLLLIGDGDLWPECNDYVHELKREEDILFIGTTQNPFYYLYNSNCFVLSSRFEGFPNVLMEAMACEIPIISTDCKTGPRELLAPNMDDSYQEISKNTAVEYGILTPTNNIDELVKAMQLIHADKNLRTTLVEKSNQRIKEFDKTLILKNYEQYFV